MPYRLRHWVCVSVIAVTAFSADTALAADREDARSDPGQLGAQWWQHALSIPAEQNPIADRTGQFCGIGQHGGIWFLHGSLGDQERGKPIERHCTIATGKSIFLPLINFLCIPFPGETLEENVQACAKSVDETNSMRLRIDGLSRNDLIERRKQTSGFFDVNVPEDNLFGAPAGVYLAVHDGYYALLPVLRPGQHTIRIQAVASASGTLVDVIYHLTVTRPGPIPPPAP